MKNRLKFNVDKGKTGQAKRTFEGIVFDSEMELKYYKEIVLEGVKNGTILHFERQKKYILQPSFIKNGKRVLPIEYKADFYIKYSDGSEEVIDVKGFAEPLAILKRKMFWYMYPNINYNWISYIKKYGGWINYDDCKRLRAQAKKEKKE